MILSFYATTILLIIAEISFADEVCYEPLGCFDDNPPFFSPRRPVPHLPWSPEEIGTKFLLFTRFSQFTNQILSYNDLSTVETSYFSPSRKTKILVHGYNSDGDSSWVLKMKNALLKAENLNVIIVDWRVGAAAAMYGQAATNTRVVGAEIAYLIKKLKETVGAVASDFHIIGHSLGAHVGGYAGEDLENLGRITGMDPAGPYFEGTPKLVRLDPDDANYVDGIHTDGDPLRQVGWGMIGPVGHADFYPNGGVDQPGCPGNAVDNGAWWRLSCSHSRAHQLFIDSIINRDKPMHAHKCSDYSTYLSGACNTCDTTGCPTLGYYSDEVADSSEDNVEYYLTTRSEAPFGSI